MGLAQEKLRAREQWSQDPCGAEYDRFRDARLLEIGCGMGTDLFTADLGIDV